LPASLAHHGSLFLRLQVRDEGDFVSEQENLRDRQLDRDPFSLEGLRVQSMLLDPPECDKGQEENRHACDEPEAARVDGIGELHLETSLFICPGISPMAKSRSP
jgi:hypothetical protein